MYDGPSEQVSFANGQEQSRGNEWGQQGSKQQVTKQQHSNTANHTAELGEMRTRPKNKKTKQKANGVTAKEDERKMRQMARTCGGDLEHVGQNRGGLEMQQTIQSGAEKKGKEKDARGVMDKTDMWVICFLSFFLSFLNPPTRMPPGSSVSLPSPDSPTNFR